MSQPQLRRARNTGIIPFIEGRLTIPVEQLKLVLKNEPENIYVLAWFDEEGKVTDFLVGYYSLGGHTVSILQLFESTNRGQMLLDHVKKWTDNQERASIEMIAEIGSERDKMLQANGFVPKRHVLQFDLVREDEVVQVEVKTETEIQPEPTNGTQPIRIEGETSQQPDKGSGADT